MENRFLDYIDDIIQYGTQSQMEAEFGDCREELPTARNKEEIREAMRRLIQAINNL